MYDKYLILDKNMTPLAPSSRNMFHNLNISKLGGYKLSKKNENIWSNYFKSDLFEIFHEVFTSHLERAIGEHNIVQKYLSKNYYFITGSVIVMT